MLVKQSMSSAFRTPRFLKFAIGAVFCFWIIIISREGGSISPSVPLLQVSPNAEKPGVPTFISEPIETSNSPSESPSSLPPANPSPADYSSTSPPTAKISFDAQKIDDLWKRAKAKQTSLLERQSKTLEDARSEYQRRYEIPPPPGYDEWYAYAKKHNSSIIDEFDDLMANLRPFRAYQEHQCQFEHNKDALPAMLPVCITNNTVDVGNPSPYDTKQIANPFIDFTSDFVEALPDMCLYINTFDEPRQVIPAQKLTALLSPDPPLLCEKHEFTNFKRQNIWSEVTVPCAENSAALDPTAPSSKSTSSLVSQF